jgi:hypothetical protein
MDFPDVSSALARHNELVADGEDNAALEVLRKAREMHGFDVGLEQTEWLFLNRRNRLDEMEPVFSRCIAEAPDHPTGYIARCWFYFRKGNISECLIASKTLSHLFPAIYEGYFFGAHCLLSLQRPDEALEVYAALAVHLSNRVEGWIGQAQILQQRRDIVSAKEVLRTGLSHVVEHRQEIIRHYISLCLIEGKSIRDVSTDVLDDLIEISGESSDTAAFLVNQLRGRVSPEVRERILQQYLKKFQNDVALVEEQIRESFQRNELHETGSNFFRIFTSSGWDRRMVFLWAEYLIRSRQWENLGAHLSDRSSLIKNSMTDLESAKFMMDAIWLCEHYGATTSLGFDDVPQVDVRLTRALSAFRKGDLLDTWDGPLPEWRARSTLVPFLRIHSFAHSSWMPTVEGADSRAVEKLVIEAFLASRPFSLIRLGDCEGNFLDRTHHTLSGATTRRDATGQFFHPRINDIDYEDLRIQFIAALRAADVVGVSNEFSILVNPGTMHCVRYIGEEIPQFQGVFTDHAVHNAMGASGFIERLAAMQLLAGRPIYYLGPHNPSQFKGLAFPTGSVRHIRIPPQAIFFLDKIENAAHYPEYFPKILDALSVIPKHAVVLVSAGILGKIYCGVAKANGALAIDIGAISDHWCGFQTRIAAQHNAWFSSGKTTINELI